MAPRELGSVTLVYDGTCAFCIRSLAFLKRFDTAGRIDVLDSSDAATVQRFPELEHEDLDLEVKAITAQGLFGGFDALREAALTTKALKPLALVTFFPGISPIGRWVYAIVAKNRHRFGCAS
jgi:predicted DCC family thiol-disulfide oxidoreductase YuxK